MELRGSSRWGEQDALCPVHGDRRPSLRVNLEKGLFFCNACDARGTAVDLVMVMESCSRAEAQERAEKLARAAGLTIQRRATHGRYQRPDAGGEARSSGGTRYVAPGRR